MVHVVTEDKVNKAEARAKSKTPQAKTAAAVATPEQTITALAWIQARHPKAVKSLLKSANTKVPAKTSARQLNDLFYNALMTKGPRFHKAVEQLVASKLPADGKHDSFMPTNEKTSDVLGAAMKIGGETGSGASGGGYFGAALGLASGITQVVANGQEKKMQKEQQRNQMFQSLLAMRNNRSNTDASATNKNKTLLIVGGAMIVVGALVFAAWRATQPAAA